MAINPSIEQFEAQRLADVYIDKTPILSLLNKRIDKKRRFLCVTMPSRFGKTYLADMVAAYYTNDGDSRKLFEGLRIAGDPSFGQHLNKHNVIKLDIAGICADTPEDEMVQAIRNAILMRLAELFPEVTSFSGRPSEAIAGLLRSRGATFVVVIDEWDYILRNHADRPDLFDEYIGLLRSLFKNSNLAPAFDLVYMTGIMPIKRYKTMSALNEFDESTMVRPWKLAPFFGFSQADVAEAVRQSGTALGIDELRAWYDGYRLRGAGEAYCPNSVVKACLEDCCGTFFGDTMATSAVTEGLRNNRIDLEGDAAILLSGGAVPVDPSEFEGDLSNLDSRDKGLTALIHSGFLSYDSETGTVRIPNREVRLFFARAVGGLSWPALNDPILGSRELLRRTINLDSRYVGEAFDRFHAALSSVFGRNREDVLSVVAYILYYAAKDDYYAFKEPNTGLGRADILFAPARPGLPGIVVELKVDEVPESCLTQIEGMRYYDELIGHAKEAILVGIAYDRATLKHSASIVKKAL